MAVCDVHFHEKTALERHGPRIAMLAAFAAIALLAAVLRVWGLGLRTFQGNETVSSLLADQIARGRGYEHLPALHGPMQYFAAAAAMRVMGASDDSARIAPAVAGVLLALLPFMFTRHIGRVGAVAAALLLAVSPSLLYYSRFAGPDIYLALFTLATAMLAWRYTVTPERAYLYLLAATMAGMVVTSEMALIVIPIFIAYFWYRSGADFASQAASPRTTTAPQSHYELLGVPPDADVRRIRIAYRKRIDTASTKHERDALAEAYSVLTAQTRRAAYDRKLARVAADAARVSEDEPGVSLPARLGLYASAGFVAALWPFVAGVRRRCNLTRLPDAAAPMLVLALLALPFYGPLVEKLPFVGDRGFDGQAQVYVLGGSPNAAPGGELPVMLATLGVLFCVAGAIGIAWRWHVWLICWAMFYGVVITMFTGFFTNKGGVWTGLWGTLDYWWRPEARTSDGPSFYYAMLVPLYEVVPIAIGLVAVVALAVRGSVRNRIALACTTLAVATLLAAPEWMAPHRTLLLCAVACGGVLALRIAPLTKYLAFWAIAAFCAFTMLGRKEPPLALHIAVPLAMLAGALVNDAVHAFEMPRISVAARPALFTPGRLAQGFVLVGVAACAAFAAYTGVLASWGHGDVPQLSAALVARDRGDTPIELLAPETTAPDVQAVREAIARAGRDSARGTDTPIAVDTSYDFAQGWLWYLRDYPNLKIEDMRKGYQAPAGSIVLFDARNRDKVHVAADATSLAFTERWSFPADYDHASASEARASITDAGWWSRWSRYVIDRERAGQPDAVQGVAYFPGELSAALPPGAQTSQVLASQVSP